MCEFGHHIQRRTLNTEPRSVFVNGRSRPVIMDDMQKRIDNGDARQERQDAIKVRQNNMCCEVVSAATRG